MLGVAGVDFTHEAHKDMGLRVSAKSCIATVAKQRCQ